VRRLLVLWDVDYTLVDAGGIGRELYQIAFRELFGRQMPEPPSMAGRTERAIVAEVLALAGEADPGQLIDRFHAVMAARAPALADVARRRTRALPGAGTALAALAGPGRWPGGDGREQAGSPRDAGQRRARTTRRADGTGG